MKAKPLGIRMDGKHELVLSLDSSGVAIRVGEYRYESGEMYIVLPNDVWISIRSNDTVDIHMTSNNPLHGWPK